MFVHSFLACALALNAARAAGPVPQPAPGISSLLKPALYKKMVEDREVLTSAELDTSQDPGRYHFYAAMLVKASPQLTRDTLTNYALYAKMIPYVDRADYSEKTKVLKIEGGIWKFKLRSEVRFEEKGERWIQYRIVGGHFEGLGGDIFFEPQGEKGTAVYFRGEQLGKKWPPAFVIERGAEIVFGFTARKMRSYIESLKSTEAQEHSHGDHEIPQPKPHL